MPKVASAKAQTVLPAADTDHVVWIRPSGRVLFPNLKELWEYRELLFFLVWRDIKVRYKQTVLGASWAILQPVATMAIFSLVFGRLAKIPSDGIPYPIFAFAALVPWTFFANGLTLATNSLTTNQNLIKKIFFPRLALPLAAIFAAVTDFLLAFTVLIIMVIAYGIVPSLTVLWLIPLFLLAFTTCIGAGLWLSALNVQYRDIGYIVPFVVQFWLFATPVAYPSSLLDEPWRTIYGINPMAGVVEGFRWALLGTDTAPGPMILVSAMTSTLLLLSGAIYFRSTERKFADIV